MTSTARDTQPYNDASALDSTLGRLVYKAILLPPQTERKSNCNDMFRLHSTGLFPLLDCLQYLHDFATTTQDATLAKMLLRTIHAVLFAKEDDSSGKHPLISSTVSYCESRGLWSSMLQLLQHSELHGIVVAILSAMIYDKEGTALNLASASQFALMTESESQDPPAAARETPVKSTATGGSKRRQGPSGGGDSAKHQANPLVIEERSPKRRRKEDSLHYSINTETVENVSLQETMGNLFESAECCAKRILAMVDPCRSMFDSNNSNSNQESLLRNLRSISAAVRLLFSALSKTLQEVDHETAGAFQTANSSSTKLLCTLVKSLQFVSTSMASHLRSSNKGTLSRSDAALSAMNVLSDAGIHAQLTGEPLLLLLGDSEASNLIECLDSIATCALLSWTTKDETRSPSTTKPTAEAAAESNTVSQKTFGVGRNGCCICKDMEGILSSKMNCCGRKRNETLCLCALCPLPDGVLELAEVDGLIRTYSPDIDDFCTDCACFQIQDMPQLSRWALFACLRPVEDAGTIHPCSTLVTIPTSSDIPTVVETPFALEFLPIYLLSFSRRRGIISTLSSVKYTARMELAIMTKSNTGGFLSLLRLEELFSLCSILGEDSDSALREVLHSGVSILSIIAGNPLVRRPPALLATRSNAWDRQMQAAHQSIRSKLMLLPCCTETEAVPVSARIAKWRCISRACTDSSLSELRMILSDAANKEDTVPYGRRLEERNSKFLNPENCLEWLIFTALADPEVAVRDFAAGRIGKVLLGGKADLLFALFSSHQEYRSLQNIPANEIGYDAGSALARSTATVIVSRLFQELDQYLFEYCSIAQSQLSLTMGSTGMRHTEDSRSMKKSFPSKEALSYQRTALNALLSFCHAADVHTPCGLTVFENSLLRLVRFWISSDRALSFETDSPSLLSAAAIPALAFGKMTRLNQERPLQSIVAQTCTESFAPALFAEVLLRASSTVQHAEMDSVNSMARQCRAHHFKLLVNFIDIFLLPAGEANILAFVHETLPYVLTGLVVETDYDLLKITTAFKIFLLGEQKRRNKILKRASSGSSFTSLTDQSVGKSLIDSIESTKVPGVETTSKELEEHTKSLCLAPEAIEIVLPRLLMNSDRSQLVFFLREVIKGKVSLNQMIKSKELVMLKAIIWELGRHSVGGNSATQALRAAAVAREQVIPDSLSDQKGANRSATPGRIGGSAEESNRSEESDVVSRWVTPNFMYLLVNVVQYRWLTRTSTEKIRALRCLNLMMRYLLPAEASQYIPQIMATVNMAMSDSLESPDSADDGSSLQVLAVQALSRFIRLFGESQYEVVGQNLTPLVVSLFPVITAVDNGSLEKTSAAAQEANRVAVGLLEWLTGSSLGKKLAKFFKDIPFLPPTPALDAVRNALKSNGVDFDNLLVLPTQNTQHGVSTRSLGSDGGTSAEHSEKETSKYLSGSRAAMRKRIYLLIPLLSHESLSVRRVVLNHLTELLLANRGLFHSLVETESGTSSSRFLTIEHSDASVSQSPSGQLRSVTDLAETLLQRCVVESDVKARQLLATCLGEVGAIDTLRLGDVHVSSSSGDEAFGSGAKSRAWQLTHPPWLSNATRYERQLVSAHLVLALKAAPSSVDQNKIAFAIQQILVLLDGVAKPKNVAASTYQSGSRGSNENSQPNAKGEMTAWLRDTLRDEGVLDTVEPYWHSHFNEIETTSKREPPFFVNSASYFLWISHWSRYMIHRSKSSIQGSWSALFNACRTAIRSPVGVSVAEFILPLLVLERLCFGSIDDERMVIQELRDVLSASVNSTRGAIPGAMGSSDRHKAVNTAFNVIETLQKWAEDEIEQKYNRTRRNQDSKVRDSAAANDFWSADESISKIEDLLQALSLQLRAEAASAVGMHARSLQLIEMAARSSVVDQIYESSSVSSTNTVATKNGKDPRPAPDLSVSMLEGIDLSFLKGVLGQLDDYETIEGISDEDDPAGHSRDRIRQKEVKGDWAGALQDYERLIQLGHESEDRSTLERGVLRCLLELGQYESVLKQVAGLSYTRSDSKSVPKNGSLDAFPFAIEAAWRLGRWSTLERVLDEDLPRIAEESKYTSEELYQVSVGKAMRGLHQRSEGKVHSALDAARKAIMAPLGSAARESYSRSYGHLIRLQSLREIENACSFLCAPSTCTREATHDPTQFSELALSTQESGWDWNGRLEAVASSDCSRIIDTRLALSRLAGDSTLEGSLFLIIGKKSRKVGQIHVSANSLAQAEAAFIRAREDGFAPGVSSDLDGFLSATRVQFSKLKHLAGESGAALRVIGNEDMIRFSLCDDSELPSLAAQSERQLVRAVQTEERDEAAYVDRFSRRLVLSTKWMVEGGLKSGSEIMDRFRMVQKLSPKLEKGHFQFAKYIDSVLESRIAALINRSTGTQHLGVDEDTLRAKVLCDDTSCQRYVLLAMEQYIEALKLDTKHLYQALPRLLSLWFEFTAVGKDATWRKSSSGGGSKADILTGQRDANALISQNFLVIPAHSFYTAISQLISRISHRNSETAASVKFILIRILYKHPAQAMWPLAWLRHSAKSDRAQIGEEIFDVAQKELAKRGNLKMQTLVGASKSLFKFLLDLAKYKPKDDTARSVKIRPWKGDAELADFVPPTQAALSVSLNGSTSNSNRNVFPDAVPRMRAFNSTVVVMGSKARPKRLKAFAVPAQQVQSRSYRASSREDAYRKAQSGDIGELHFLVKQEARGDLRKDARVQDLNNVINRLLSASNSAGGSVRQRRRLHIRTFAVTCLSEDCGILEWVPNTEALRSLVSNSYNPQASPFSVKRRGRRLANFGDHSLRTSFERCQEMFFKNGDLSRAANMFTGLCRDSYPPLLYWWFVQHFMDPHAWYEARTRFVLSSAAWSAVGHVIGLGDRHSENILVDTTSGDCVHVDFDCIFDKGLGLPKPEVVPFRLTSNMLDAFGPTGADGIYTGSLMTAMSTLRDNRDTLLSVLEPFLKDPIIDWRRHRSQQKQGKSSSSSNSETAQAKRSIKVIDERLRGIYNLRNPNLQKVKRTDGWSVDQDDEMTHLMPLSVEGQVHKMISEATSHENLVQLYVGWMPWI